MRHAIVVILAIASLAFVGDSFAGVLEVFDGSVAIGSTVGSNLRTYKINIDPEIMLRPRLTGRVVAEGGSGNDIEIYVMRETDYQNWINDHRATITYQSGRVTAADVDVSLNASGTWVLVFSNMFSTVSNKNASGRLVLTWEEPSAKVASEMLSSFWSAWGSWLIAGSLVVGILLLGLRMFRTPEHRRS